MPSMPLSSNHSRSINYQLERVPLESDSPVILRVTEQRVQRALDVLNPRKACGTERTPSWLVKEYCDLMAHPIKEILNASYAAQRLPTIWKMADVTPLPKKKTSGQHPKGI